MNTTIRIAVLAMIGALLCNTVLASEPANDPAHYLEFEQRLDGRCYNLSEGGKLMVMHNRHPSKSIEYRLIRFFAKVPQSGRAMGTAAPGDTPVKLGCTEIDGRPQYWEIERSQFVTD